MRASVVLVVVGALFAGVSPAAPPLPGSVKLAPGVRLEDEDLFVVWTDSCAAKTRAGGKHELVQKNFHYAPRALVALLGDKLLVHNRDEAKHNSFALQNVAFDSGLQKPGTTYEVALGKPGVTKVFCRIHSKMAADVLVLTNPCYRELRGAKALGAFELPAPLGGKTKAWLWSPRLKSFRSLEAKAGARVDFTLTEKDFLEAAPPPPPDDRDVY
jgi:plastocyanin